MRRKTPTFYATYTLFSHERSVYIGLPNEKGRSIIRRAALLPRAFAFAETQNKGSFRRMTPKAALQSDFSPVCRTSTERLFVTKVGVIPHPHHDDNLDSGDSCGCWTDIIMHSRRTWLGLGPLCKNESDAGGLQMGATIIDPKAFAGGSYSDLSHL